MRRLVHLKWLFTCTAKASTNVHQSASISREQHNRNYTDSSSFDSKSIHLIPPASVQFNQIDSNDGRRPFSVAGAIRPRRQCTSGPFEAFRTWRVCDRSRAMARLRAAAQTRRWGCSCGGVPARWPPAAASSLHPPSPFLNCVDDSNPLFCNVKNIPCHSVFSFSLTGADVIQNY